MSEGTLTSMSGRAALERALDGARAEHPGFAVSDEIVLAFFVARLERDSIAVARVPDLYLACACAEGDAAAIATFDRLVAAIVERVVPRRADRPRLGDEVRQTLAERLLVPRDGEPAKILDYSGRGDLVGWLRVAASRVMLNLLHSEKRRSTIHDEHGSEPLAAEDPELARIEHLHRDDFRAALRDAAADLTPRERNLLRQHHIDGLTMDQLATMYSLHRVTVIRTIGAARDKLANGTRKRLRERLRIGQRELDSLLRVVGSKIELTIKRYLEAD